MSRHHPRLEAIQRVDYGTRNGPKINGVGAAVIALACSEERSGVVFETSLVAHAQAIALNWGALWRPM